MVVLKRHKGPSMIFYSASANGRFLQHLLFSVLMCTSVELAQELLGQEKAQASRSINQEVDLDELMDVSYLMCLCIVNTLHSLQNLESFS